MANENAEEKQRLMSILDELDYVMWVYLEGDACRIGIPQRILEPIYPKSVNICTITYGKKFGSITLGNGTQEKKPTILSDLPNYIMRPTLYYITYCIAFGIHYPEYFIKANCGGQTNLGINIEQFIEWLLPPPTKQEITKERKIVNIFEEMWYGGDGTIVNTEKYGDLAITQNVSEGYEKLMSILSFFYTGGEVT